MGQERQYQSQGDARALLLHSQARWARVGVEVKPGLTSWDFRDLGACLRHYTLRLFRVCFYSFAYGQRVLFDSGASHSFIPASCVKDLSLEVETLENPLYVNSPLGTRVSIDLIC